MTHEYPSTVTIHHTHIYTKEKETKTASQLKLPLSASRLKTETPFPVTHTRVGAVHKLTPINTQITPPRPSFYTKTGKPPLVTAPGFDACLPPPFFLPEVIFSPLLVLLIWEGDGS